MGLLASGSLSGHLNILNIKTGLVEKSYYKDSDCIRCLLAVF
jgi:hypothetical protein